MGVTDVSAASRKRIRPTQIHIDTTSLPGGTVGSAYSASLTASGGTPPYTWGLVSGVLPPGLSLSTSGAVNGTPSSSGTWSFSVQVQDSAASPQNAQATFSIAVVAVADPNPPALQITTTSLPSGVVSTAYGATLTGTGGTPPYTWAIAIGQLPTGLTLSASNGVISGTPTSASTWTFTVQLKDAAASPQIVTATFSIAIAAASSSGNTIPATFFGMLQNQLFWKSEPWPSAQFGGSRLWDVGVTWADLEPSCGSYTWSMMDQWITVTQQHHVDVLYVFGHTPPWAVSNCTSNYGAPNWCAEPPANEQDWKDFVTALVTRYKGQIQYYELWNEITDKGFWNGTIYQLAQMAKDAYGIIKSIDPNAVVLSPTPTGGGTWPSNKLECYLKPVGQPCPTSAYLSSSETTGAGGAAWADVIAFHGYVGVPAENIVQQIGYYKTAMSNAGVTGKPLWDTEASWGSNSSFTDLNQRAGFVARTFLLKWSNGLTRFYWYSWDNGSWGTLWSSTGIQPAGIAYQQVYNWMVGNTMSTPCASNSTGLWTCGFSGANGYQSLAVWQQSNTASFTVPSGYKQYRDLSGNVYPTSAGTVLTITGNPILLEN